MINKLIYPYENLSLLNMDGEIWKDIPGCEGYYMASNLGRIKAVARETIHSRYGVMGISEKIIKQRQSRDSCLIFSATIDGVQSCRSVARSVYSAFIKRLPQKSEPNNFIVLYRDNDPKNTKVDNLYIISREEQAKNLNIQGLFGADVSNYTSEQWQKIRNSVIKPISQYSIKGKYIQSFDSQAEAHRLTGVGNCCIHAAVKGRTKVAGGFIWRYGRSTENLSTEFLASIILSSVSRPAKPIRQYDMQGNYLNTYKSITKAARATKIQNRKLSYHLKKGNTELEGYLWYYADEEIFY